ncbi:ROK family protein [Bacillus sp. FJAT-53711]|uniref:ROK family protein n=1 Tax=Bacillus yunxiaonensis TaxID=3127665 RepID=A0ABU8FZB4_9BACI
MLQQFVGLVSPKMKNLKHLYGLIHKTGPVDKNTLMKLTSYRSATCARLIEELLQAELIYESGLGKSSGGRKPSMYTINPAISYVVGVDISSTYTTVLLLDLNLNIVDSATLEMTWQITAEYTLQFIIENIEQMLTEHDVQHNQLLGIGVGAIGPLDREKGIILTPKTYISDGWENVNIVRPLKQHFNTLVLLDNGANLAALGEYQNDYMKEVNNLIFTIPGIGIRCGIISNGEIVRGKIDVEGSFGHIPVDIHGRQCWCGSFGCLVAYSSIPSVRKEIIDRIKRGNKSIIQQMVDKLDDVQFNHILNALEKNDALCEDVIREAAFYYGIALATLTHLLYPDVVVIGGTLGTNQLFYEVASETALQRVRNFSDYPVQFVQPSLKYDTVAIGAGSMIFNYFVE